MGREADTDTDTDTFGDTDTDTAVQLPVDDIWLLPLGAPFATDSRPPQFNRVNIVSDDGTSSFQFDAAISTGTVIERCVPECPYAPELNILAWRDRSGVVRHLLASSPTEPSETLWPLLPVGTAVTVRHSELYGRNQQIVSVSDAQGLVHGSHRSVPLSSWPLTTGWGGVDVSSVNARTIYDSGPGERPRGTTYYDASVGGVVLAPGESLLLSNGGPTVQFRFGGCSTTFSPFEPTEYGCDYDFFRVGD
ncbi:MAG: hypothetical protein ACI855_000948 [Myxococcota bacterium]|jgi:hypothetical protein